MPGFTSPHIKGLQITVNTSPASSSKTSNVKKPLRNPAQHNHADVDIERLRREWQEKSKNMKQKTSMMPKKPRLPAPRPKPLPKVEEVQEQANYPCSICNDFSGTLKDLDKHLQAHVSEEIKNHDIHELDNVSPMFRSDWFLDQKQTEIPWSEILCDFCGIRYDHHSICVSFAAVGVNFDFYGPVSLFFFESN